MNKKRLLQITVPIVVIALMCGLVLLAAPVEQALAERNGGSLGYASSQLNQIAKPGKSGESNLAGLGQLKQMDKSGSGGDDQAGWNLPKTFTKPDHEGKWDLHTPQGKQLTWHSGGQPGNPNPGQRWDFPVPPGWSNS